VESQRQVCTFFLNGLLLGIDTELIKEVIRYQEMTPVPLAPPAVSGLMNLRGQIVTGIDLRRRFLFDERADARGPINVVVHTKKGTVSLIVDEIGDVFDVSEDECEAAPENLTGVARELIQGAYKLAGQLLLILDTEQAVCLAD